MICKKIHIAFVLLLATSFTEGQNFHAIQGSPYAGSIGVHNNPSSIVSTPYKWDLTIIGAQTKGSTNILNVRNYSLLSKPSESEYLFTSGTYKRDAIANANVNLLNARIAINRQQVIAFGANLRNYATIRTSEYNYHDTLHELEDFLSLNEGNQPLWGDYINSGWIELYGSYGQTILENETSRLNAGITLKLSRGIAGAHSSLQNGRYSRAPLSNPAIYNITEGDARYGYSSNFDRWEDTKSKGQNLRDFINYSEGGLSIDMGAELLIKTQATPLAFEDDGYFDYEWKLGVSVLDLGVNQYKYGLQSRYTHGINPGVTSETIDQKFDSTISSLRIFNDSLATIVTTYAILAGKFRVLNPTRLVLNADRFVTRSFFINAEVSINLSGIFGKKWLYVKEMNVITVTPRWENRRWGVYMPLTYNTRNQFWVGGAAKFGPILFGLHNLGYIFSKNSIHKGGGYIAIIIHSRNDTGNKKDKQLDCPPGTMR